MDTCCSGSLFIHNNTWFTMMDSHSLELLRIAWLFSWQECMGGMGFPYVTLNNQWSCDSETCGRKSWQRSSPPLAFSRRAEAGNNLAIIKGHKPCHAAIRPNSRRPISYDINGRNQPRLCNSALLWEGKSVVRDFTVWRTTLDQMIYVQVM